jgi:3-oxoadipate enol-lactonase
MDAAGAQHAAMTEIASLEVITDSGAPVIGAAHPADLFDAATVALLTEMAGAGVACLNPRGLGGSPPAPPGYGLDEMVADLEATRRRRGFAPWVFWGMSGGGWLGQIYAHRYPEALRGLVLESVCPCFRERLADPACVLSPLHPPWQPSLAARGLIAEDAHAEVGDPGATEWIEVAGLGSVFRRRGGPALLVVPMPVGETMRARMPALWAADARSWLPQLRVPTLVIAGSADPVVPLAHARACAEAIPGAELLVVDGGGHVPTVERRPEVREAVRRFLARL